MGTVATLARLARSRVGTSADLGAGRGDHEPGGAEGVQALAVLLAGPAVTGVVVQRVVVIGDLGGVVAALDRAQQRGLDAAARFGVPLLVSTGQAAAQAPLQADWSG
jgi:hypothetical protein